VLHGEAAGVGAALEAAKCGLRMADLSHSTHEPISTRSRTARLRAVHLWVRRRVGVRVREEVL